jgi:aminoglycoside 6-adenylyltransferase
MSAKNSQEFYSTLEAKITAWAQAEDDLRAAIVVGSRTRSDHPADEWSDLDVILFLRRPEQYIARTDWIEAFCPLWLSVVQKTVAGEPERLVVFEGGYQTDFVFNDCAVLQMVPQMLESGNIPDTIRRGVRVLVDKEDALTRVPPPMPVAPQQPPSADEFAETGNRFWFNAVYASHQLARGDLVFYKSCESGLRWGLLQMLEWHARAVHGWDFDTWHGGRYTRDWLDPEIYAALADTYGGLDQHTGWDNLCSLTTLFARFESEVAERLDYQVPKDKREKVLTLFAEMRGAVT